MSLLYYYIKDYDVWRPFLQLLSYGCYHKAFIVKKLQVSGRTYDQHWARVRFFLPKDRLHVTRLGHQEIHSLQGDSYHAADNYLARTYRLHALTDKKAFYFLTLLSALQHTQIPLDENTLTSQVFAPLDRPLPEGITDISRSSVHRHLGELSDLGLISCVQENGHAAYRAAEDPLDCLNPAELNALLDAVCAYRTFSHLAAPGYLLEAAIRHRRASSHVPAAPMLQLKHIAPSRILDDAVAYTLLCCIKQHRTCSFFYRNERTKRHALPQRLLTDFHTGRQYLEALAPKRKSDDYTLSQRYRLDQMVKVEMGKRARPARKASVPAARTPSPLLLRFHVQSKREEARIRYRLRQRFPSAQRLRVIRRDAHTLEASLFQADALALVPWLRTFFPALEIPVTQDRQSTFLRQKLREDLEEAIANYEKSPTPVS